MKKLVSMKKENSSEKDLNQKNTNLNFYYSIFSLIKTKCSRLLLWNGKYPKQIYKIIKNSKLKKKNKSKLTRKI